MGAEEMVENLTTKCLDLEDQLAAIIEEKHDLEALHDMNEELQVRLSFQFIIFSTDLNWHGKSIDCLGFRSRRIEICLDV